MAEEQKHLHRQPEAASTSASHSQEAVAKAPTPAGSTVPGGIRPAATVLTEKIDLHFAAQSVDAEGQQAMQDIRDACKAAAHIIAARTMICADQTASLRHLEDAMFTANAAIARKGK